MMIPNHKNISLRQISSKYNNYIVPKFDNDAARDLIKSLGLEMAVTTIRPRQFVDESTAAKWAAVEQAIVDLFEHLKIEVGG